MHVTCFSTILSHSWHAASSFRSLTYTLQFLYFTLYLVLVLLYLLIIVATASSTCIISIWCIVLSHVLILRMYAI